MKLSLRVEYTNPQIMSDEPMGDFFEFDTIEEFIYFNRRELSILKDFYPDKEDFCAEVEQKLLDREFYIEPYTEDSSYVVVRDIHHS